MFKRMQYLIFITFLSTLLFACGGGGGGGTPVDDGGGDTANNAPVATDSGVSVLPGNSVSGTLNVSDADGDSLTYSIVTPPTNGSVTIDNTATGDYTYTLNNSAGADSFTFWANDGLLDSNIATVTVTGTIAAAPASNLAATAGDQRITLNWDAVPGADSYTVYWSNVTGTGTSGTAISNISPPFYHDGVTNGTNYYYVVTSVNAAGESPASAEVTATPADILISSLSFDDANLAACVNTYRLTNVNELTALYCDGTAIRSLVGIENLTSLTDLRLSKNSISDVTPLAGLTSLTYLGLNYNSISDITPLAGMTRLTTLYLSTNNISDVTPLAGLTSLTVLSLTVNSISDVTPLSGLTSLTYLGLRSNSIGGQNVGNVDALTSLTNADPIDLRGNLGMSCAELTTLIAVLGSRRVIIEGNVVTNGLNCTNP